MVSLKANYRLDTLLTLVGLARSTYYYHLKKLREHHDKHARLKQEIFRLFHENHKVYGCRRIRLALLNRGWVVSKNLVHTLMRSMGLRCVIRRRKYQSYRGRVGKIAGNVLRRDFVPPRPNQSWVTDVTMFQVAGKRVYLSPVMDLYDRSIIGYSTSLTSTVEFAVTSLKQAFTQAGCPHGVVVHSDQGYHYQHESWRGILDMFGGIQSMSRKGNCWDNAVMENFFGHMKAEMFHGRCFTSTDELITAIREYITWYNMTRLQGVLGGRTPIHARYQALVV